MASMAGVSDDAVPELDPMIGTEIGGRYAVHGLLARGGMGAVYKGVHLELGRTVAIKVLSNTYVREEEAVKRFQREARTAGRIDHPNIVAILDLGRLGSGEPYLVMELLEGYDLADCIAREAPLRPDRVVELLRPVANALDMVHAEGLLHRDIKPANIFLAERPDGSVTPKLLDFGLAALRDGTDADRLTREGIVVGTPHYVSPEAAEGEAVDERTDVYSLGLVAFEMLAGVLPIESERPISLMYAKVRRPAPTLSQRTGKSFPPAIEQLIARTLSRTPDRRPPSAGAFVEALAAAVRELPPDATEVDLPKVEREARAQPERERAMVPSEPTRLPGERRLGWIVAVIAALSLCAIGLGAWLATREEAGAPVAEEPARPEPSVREPEPAEADPAPTPAPVVAGPTVAEPPAASPPRAARTSAPRAEPAAASAPPPPPTAPANAAATSGSQSAQPPAVERSSARAAELTREAGAALVRGELPRARQLYRQATFHDDEHAPAWRGLGLSSERMGLVPEAASAYRRYLRLAPSASDAARVRARLAALAGEEAP